MKQARDSRPSCCGVRGLWQMLGNRGHRSSAATRSVRREVRHCSSFRAVKVAVKVIHPQVRRAVELDLKFLTGIAWMVDCLGFDSLGVSLALRKFVDFLEVQADF